MDAIVQFQLAINMLHSIMYMIRHYIKINLLDLKQRLKPIAFLKPVFNGKNQVVF